MVVAGFRLPPDDFEVPDYFKVFKDFNDSNDSNDFKVVSGFCVFVGLRHPLRFRAVFPCLPAASMQMKQDINSKSFILKDVFYKIY